MAKRRISTPPPQGVDEAIRYAIDATPAAISVVNVSVYDETEGGVDVSGSVLSGAASVQGGNILLPLLANLQAGHLYRVEVQYSDGTSTLEPFFNIKAER